MKNLGQIIKDFRDTNSMSMDDFAKISGISKSYISILEKNKHPKTGNQVTPTLDTINNVAKATGIDINYILEEIGDQLIKINVPKEETNSKNPKDRVIELLGEDVVAANTGINIDEFTDEELDQVADRLLDYARFLLNDKKLDK